MTTRPGHLRCDGSEHPPDWRAYVAVNGHVRVLLPTPTLVPLIAQRVANTAASSSRVTHMNEHGHTRGRLEQPFAPTLEVRPQWLDTSGHGRDAIRSATLDVKAPTQQLLRMNHAPSPLPAPVVVELSRQLLVSARRDPWAQHLH